MSNEARRMKLCRAGRGQVMTGDPVGLVLFDRARQALAEAHSVDEVKTIRDQAEALRAYLKQQSSSLVMQNQCAEIRLRAERKLGELLAETVRPGPKSSRDVRNTRLPEGVSYMQSHRWQTVATMPEEPFEEHVVQVTARGEELTTAGVIRLARAIQDQLKREAFRAEPLPQVSPESNGVLPLEVMWPTPRTLLQTLAHRYYGSVDDLRKLRLERDPWTEMGAGSMLPGVTEALVGLETATQEIERQIEQAVVRVEKAAEELIKLAQSAPENPIPWPPGEGAAALSEVNARQKNSRGYCGHVGCWQPADRNGWCVGHLNGCEGPCGEQPPAAVFEPAANGDRSGARPCWSYWGLEALSTRVLDSERIAGQAP